jgi:hypothetical protein
MPSDDLILDLRQIEGFPPATTSIPSDAILIQRGGLGGPYMSIDPVDFVGTALANGGNLAVGGQVSAGSIQGGSLQFSNGAFGLLNATAASIGNLTASWGSIDTLTSTVATFVQAAVAGLSVSGDMQVGGTANMANAVVQANLSVGGATFFGNLTATNLTVSNIATIGTGLVVDGNFAVSNGTGTIGGYPIVTSGNLGLSGLAPLASPAFTGTPTAPTQPIGPTPPTDNSTALATTAFVVGWVNAGFAPLDSASLSGLPTAPTAPIGTSTGQLATTAFVMAAVTASTTGVASFNGRTGAVTLELADVTAVGGAPAVSPTFTGSPSAPTPATGNSSQLLATTAFVANTVAAVDAGVTTFNGRSGAVVMQTADITGAGGALASNAGVSSFNGRTGAIALTANDVSAAGGVAANSPALTGVPTAPTATPATLSSTQLATTAFVQNAISAGVGGYLPLTGGTVAGNLNVLVNQTAAITADGSPFRVTTQNAFTFPGTSNYDAVRAQAVAVAGSTVANVSGVAAYVRNFLASTGSGAFNNACGFYSVITAEANNARVWGLNTICQDGPPNVAIGPNALTGNFLIGYEVDFNVNNAATPVLGVVVTGGSGSAQPSQAQGFVVNQLGSSKWTSAFWSAAGAAVNGLDLGAQALTGNSINSQPIVGHYFDASGAARQSTWFVGPSGNWNASGGGIGGVTDGSAAAAGSVGELVTASFPATGIASQTIWNIGSFTIPPGDWDLSGVINFSVSDSSATQQLQGGPCNSATTLAGYDLPLIFSPGGLGGSTFAIPTTRVSSSGSTLVYFNAYSFFSSGTVSVSGRLNARRVR